MEHKPQLERQDTLGEIKRLRIAKVILVRPERFELPT